MTHAILTAWFLAQLRTGSPRREIWQAARAEFRDVSRSDLIDAYYAADRRHWDETPTLVIPAGVLQAALARAAEVRL